LLTEEFPVPDDWLESSAPVLPLNPFEPEQAWEVWPWSVTVVDVMAVGESVEAEFAVVRADEPAASGTATSSAVVTRRRAGVRMRRPYRRRRMTQPVRTGRERLRWSARGPAVAGEVCDPLGRRYIGRLDCRQRGHDDRRLGIPQPLPRA
jgi:hypothetical protein